MSTTNAFGGKNYFLATCFVSVGAFSVFAIIIFTIVHFKNLKNAPIYENMD